jgi:hypothetical protein
MDMNMSKFLVTVTEKLNISNNSRQSLTYRYITFIEVVDGVLFLYKSSFCPHVIYAEGEWVKIETGDPDWEDEE